MALEKITPDTPKDTLLLVWGAEGFSIASYDSINAEWYAEVEGKLVNGSDECLVNPNPSHWMWLPPIPR